MVNSDVKVVISMKKVAGKLAFGMPFLLATMETKTVPYTVCSGIDEVKKLFPEDTNTYKAAEVLFMQTNAPAKVAVCGTTEKATIALEKEWDKDWRQLILTSNDTEGDDTLSVVSKFVEAKKNKILFAKVDSLEQVTSDIKANERTAVLLYQGSSIFPQSALVGATAGLPTGSFTYKNITLKGINPDVGADVDKAHEAGAICFVTKAGDNVTSEGKVLSGEYIDIVDAKDYIVSNIEYSVQKVLNQSDKIPYDNNGIAMLESAVRLQ